MSAVAEKPASPPEEQSTKFRPSENFKHMKKYLKWKFENASPDASNDSSLTPTSSPGDEEKVKPLTEVQPPLPPYLPPPGVYIKEEVNTNDYEDREPDPSLNIGQSESIFNTSDPSLNISQSESIFNTSDPSLNISQPESVLNTSVVEPKETMCRNFVRGTCKNEYTCKFAHKIIKDQLKMVYTFCKEFQNKGCSLQDCRYVHCTVFDQEEFYRTGKLPPHATKHIQQRQSRSQETTHPGVPDQFHISSQHHVLPPQPIMNTSFETSAAMVPVGCSPLYTNGTDSLHYGQNEYQYEPACSSSSNKRPWTSENQFHVSSQHQVMPPQPTMDTSFENSAALVPVGCSAPYTIGRDSLHYGQSGYQYEPACSTSSNSLPSTSDTVNTQRDLDFRDHLNKKCEDCDKNELRCEVYKKETLKMVAEAVEREQNFKQLDEKTKLLIKILKHLGVPVDVLDM